MVLISSDCFPIHFGRSRLRWKAENTEKQLLKRQNDYEQHEEFENVPEESEQDSPPEDEPDMLPEPKAATSENEKENDIPVPEEQDMPLEEDSEESESAPAPDEDIPNVPEDTDEPEPDVKSESEPEDEPEPVPEETSNETEPDYHPTEPSVAYDVPDLPEEHQEEIEESKDDDEVVIPVPTEETETGEPAIQETESEPEPTDEQNLDEGVPQQTERTETEPPPADDHDQADVHHETEDKTNEFEETLPEVTLQAEEEPGLKDEIEHDSEETTEPSGTTETEARPPEDIITEPPPGANDVDVDVKEEEPGEKEEEPGYDNDEVIAEPSNNDAEKIDPMGETQTQTATSITTLKQESTASIFNAIVQADVISTIAMQSASEQALYDAVQPFPEPEKPTVDIDPLEAENIAVTEESKSTNIEEKVTTTTTEKIASVEESKSISTEEKITTPIETNVDEKTTTAVETATAVTSDESKPVVTTTIEIVSKNETLKDLHQ